MEPGAVNLKQEPFERLIRSWFELTIALNGMNRSMGLPDAYPFRIGDRAMAKLAFIHETLTGSGAAAAGTSVTDPKAAGTAAVHETRRDPELSLSS